MKEKILRLCKRLNKFELNEIELISEVPQNELLPILEELTNENKLLFKDNTYFYNKEITTSKRISKLPLMFQYHKPETIDLIIKCFCADIEVNKAINIVEPRKNCMNKFYKFFRECIYTKQYEELLLNFSSNPKIGRPREYFNKTVYLYLYNEKLFVSEKLLKDKKAKDFTDKEWLLIKNLYLKSMRKVLNKAYTDFFHIHLAEHLWRNNKLYNDLLEELNFLLYF